MTMPNAAEAVVPPEKLTGYLLAVTHPVGGSKARFFRAHGFDDETANDLADGLRAIALSDTASARPSPFGTKFVVAGDLPTPRGTIIHVETIWIIEGEDGRRRLVTAYPA